MLEMKLRSLTSQDTEEMTRDVSLSMSSEEALSLREAPHEGPVSIDDLECMMPRVSHQPQPFRHRLKILLFLSATVALMSFYSQPAFASAGAEGSGFSIVQALKGNSHSHDDTPVPFMSCGVILTGFADFILHLDVHLSSIISKHGTMTYALLFGIVFCETGLVLTPFLPGDSLLFVAGALAGLGKLNMALVCTIFIVAAIVGDAVNYAVGAWLGQKAVNANIISKSNIDKTEQFFKAYGGKTIVLARFVPIVRTFAPFVAGMSQMNYQRFATFNVGGALLWTCLFCGTGYFFGNLPFVEKNFSLVVLAIVAISVLPILYEMMAAKNHQTNKDATSSQSPQT